LFCAPSLKADANTLQNHNHPHMNCLPFLGHKKWEAVHLVVAFLLTLIHKLMHAVEMHTEEVSFTEVLLPMQAL
ncbi:MAG: hypothetical protein KHX99_06925, partial [Atopobium sp.]|nr:hypothetical protein [Atopobium sp.]